MAVDRRQVERLVREQLERIAVADVRRRIAELLVVPHCEMREWDYGESGLKYACWFVLVHAASRSGIAYCEEGFGPEQPWGVQHFEEPHATIGMDAQWHATLEAAFRMSGL